MNPLSIEFVSVYKHGNERFDVIILAVGGKQHMLNDKNVQLCCNRLSQIDIALITEWKIKFCPFCARKLKLVEYVTKG